MVYSSSNLRRIYSLEDSSICGFKKNRNIFQSAESAWKLEKMEAGMEYDFWDDEVNARKASAMDICKRLNGQDPKDEEKIADTLRELFESAGRKKK